MADLSQNRFRLIPLHIFCAQVTCTQRDIFGFGTLPKAASNSHPPSSSVLFCPLFPHIHMPPPQFVRGFIDGMWAELRCFCLVRFQPLLHLTGTAQPLMDKTAFLSGTQLGKRERESRLDRNIVYHRSPALNRDNKCISTNESYSATPSVACVRCIASIHWLEQVPYITTSTRIMTASAYITLSM